MTIRKASCLVMLALGFTGAASAQPARSTVRTPQFENESVRVWRTTIAPSQPLTMHRHESGRVIVALTGGNAYWLPADPPGEKHGDLNEGKEPIEVMVVELVPRNP